LTAGWQLFAGGFHFQRHQQPIKRQLYCCGVARSAVVELDTWAKFKGPGEAVVAGCPRLGERGDEFRRNVVVRYESVKDVGDDMDRFGDVRVNRVQRLGIV